jgi:hypothetical protein
VKLRADRARLEQLLLKWQLRLNPSHPSHDQ